MNSGTRGSPVFSADRDGVTAAPRGHLPRKYTHFINTIHETPMLTHPPPPYTPYPSPSELRLVLGSHHPRTPNDRHPLCSFS